MHTMTSSTSASNREDHASFHGLELEIEQHGDTEPLMGSDDPPFSGPHLRHQRTEGIQWVRQSQKDANDVVPKSRSSSSRYFCMILWLGLLVAGYLWYDGKTLSLFDGTDFARAVNYKLPLLSNDDRDQIGATRAPTSGGTRFTAINDHSPLPPPAMGFLQSDWEFFDIDRAAFNLSDYDEISPYADLRRNMTFDERKKELDYWIEKMENIRQKWGYWNFPPALESYKGKPRPTIDWESAPLRDVDIKDFPKGAWQADPEYMGVFLKEAKALVNRTKEAIYAEYGYPLPLDEAQLEDRATKFGIWFREYGQPPGAEGVAVMPQTAYHGLVKKLLHAMMTNDDFHFVLGGHSAAAGHGNNFHQSYAMEFHKVMEPVFRRLGMTLHSRNIAQGGVGTVQTSLAGSSIYGEADFIIWDSGMTEPDGSHIDLYMRQAVLSGERLPFLMITVEKYSGMCRNLYDEAGLDFMCGVLRDSGRDTIPLTKSEDTREVEKMPYATQYMFCDTGISVCGTHRFNAYCWVDDRVDVVPPVRQDPKPGSQVSWHPGDRAHRWSGRKYALIFLLALETALEQWDDITSAYGHPLPNDYWHVSEAHSKVKRMVRDRPIYHKTPSMCESFMDFLPRACHTAMNGISEWTPRANPDETSIHGKLKPALDGYLPAVTETNQYEGTEVLFPGQRIPTNDVDVVAIAHALPKGYRGHRFLANQRVTLGVRETHPSVKDSSRPAPSTTSFAARRDLQVENDEDDKPVPGRGWVTNHPPGTCDGTIYSTCGRRTSTSCVMLGHNDGRSNLIGDGLSGWLVMTLPKVQEGIIMIFMWPSGPSPATEGWTVENNGLTLAVTDPNAPSSNPSAAPSVQPSAVPSSAPSATPSHKPSTNPSAHPSLNRRAESHRPSAGPSAHPSSAPSATPSSKPSANPSALPSSTPSATPSHKPSALPSSNPTTHPSSKTQEGRKLSDEIGSEQEISSGHRHLLVWTDFPDTFQFQFAINGKITTWSKSQFIEAEHQLQRIPNVRVLLDDVEMAKLREPKDIELAIRLQGVGREFGVELHHVYFA